MKYIFLFLLVICCNALLHAQTISKHSVLFYSGRYDIPKDELGEMQRLADSLATAKDFIAEIQGNADSIGDDGYNKSLSEERTHAIRDLFIANGVPAKHITIRAFSSHRPVADNATPGGRQLNRRADIIIRYDDSWRPDFVTEDSLKNLYKFLEEPMQEFCVNTGIDTILRCREGSIIYVKANSLKPNAGCGTRCVTIRVKEALRKSGMIMENLTTTSDRRILQTGGMIYTEAVDCNGNKLTLQKDLVIMVPADTVRKDAWIFNGQRGHDEIMNWAADNSQVLRSFNLKSSILCGGINDKQGANTGCAACKFFFCRIGRFGKAVQGSFSRPVHEENISFRECQRQRKKPRKNNSGTNTGGADRNMLNQVSCDDLIALLKQYGVSNYNDLVVAVNKPLMDSFKVSNLSQLRDTLSKLNTKKIEMAYAGKSISFEDFSYYIFNQRGLGWRNIDCFSGYPKDQLVNMRVNVRPDMSTDCKLVFKNTRSILAATARTNVFEFSGVPAGEKALIVVIRHEGGEPYLGMQEITIGAATYNIELQKLSLDQLKQRLKQLDE